MKEIGEALQEARENIGITIEEAANDLKLKPSQIEDIEAGNNGPGNANYLLATRLVCCVSSTSPSRTTSPSGGKKLGILASIRLMCSVQHILALICLMILLYFEGTILYINNHPSLSSV